MRRSYNNISSDAGDDSGFGSLVFNVDFRTSTTETINNCTYYTYAAAGYTNTSTVYPRSQYGIYVAFSTRYRAAIGYDLTPIISTLKSANQITVQIDYYCTAYPSSGTNNYQTFRVMANNAVKNAISTSAVSYLSENLRYRGMGTAGTTGNETAEINKFQTFTTEFHKNGDTWNNTTSNSTSYGIDTGTFDRNPHPDAYRLASAKTSTPLYFLFPVKVWGDPQKFTGYIQGLRIYVN